MGKAIDLPAILPERAKKEGRASGVLEVHCVNEKDTRPGRPHLKIWISGAKIRRLCPMQKEGTQCDWHAYPLFQPYNPHNSELWAEMLPHTFSAVIK